MSSPGASAAPAACATIATPASHTAQRQRRLRGRPPGNRRNSSCGVPNSAGRKSHEPSHAAPTLPVRVAQPSASPATAKSSPAPQNSQPIAFSGRREATSAPTTGNESSARVTTKSKAGVTSSAATVSTQPASSIATDAVQRDQASRLTARS